MAYGLKYTQYISKGDTTLRVNVYAKDWTGATYGMAHILGASLQIVGGQADIISPIIKTSFSWSMADAWDQGTAQADGTTCVNAQGEKCGRWEEFYTKDATKFRVEVLNGSTVIWKGYVTPDSWTEEMQYHGSVTITARDMLGALQDAEFDLTGRVTVLDVVRGALAACECPMDLSYVQAHFLVNENGQSILDHDFAASTFSGRNWYQALQDTLESLGLVLRYNGVGQIVLTSLRYISADTLQGHHEVAYANLSGLRSLDPALKLITETFDLERNSYVPKDPDAAQFTATGGTITCSMTVTRPGSTPQTATGVVKAYTLARTGSEGWSGNLGIPMYGTAESGAVLRGIYFPCGTQDPSNTLEAVYTNTKLDRAFRFSLALDGGLMQVTNGGTAAAVFKAPLTSSFIYIPDITVRVQCVANGVAHYLNSEGVWVTDITYRSIQPGETVTVPMLTNATNYQIVVKRVNLAGSGRPIAPLVAPLILEVGPDDNATSPTEFKTTTNYDQENNVTITRTPAIGSADVYECPEFISNALGYDDAISADRWNWPGEASFFPLAVMIQAQVLCFYAAAASVFTGTAVDRAADFALPGYAFDYYERRGIPVSGVYDFASGFAVQSTVREVYSWEEVWGESFAPEYTQVSGAGKGSTSATGSGGSSSGGSGGGGSVAPGVSMAAVQEWVNAQGYATQSWVTDKGYLTGITDDMIADALGYTPLAPDDLLGYATQSWVTGQGYITGITSTMVTDALGYTPWYASNHPTTLSGYGITDAVEFNQDIQDLGATHQMGYGYATHGWPYSGPAMTFGSGKFTAQIQSSASGNVLYYRQTVNGTAQSWVEIYHSGNANLSTVNWEANQMTAQSFKLASGAPTLTWDSNANAWHLSGNFYADGFISSGGVSTGGGASGIDLGAMWASLTNSISDAYAATKIAPAHIPSIQSIQDFNAYVYSAQVSRTANTVLAAPNGSSGVASFRKLVAADIPDLSGTYLPLNVGPGKTITSTSNVPITINTTSTSNEVGFRYQLNGGIRAFFGYNAASAYGTFMYNYAGPYYLGITDAGVANFNGNALLHAGNYTSYVNTTNFPGLNKTGTVTSVAMTVPTGLSVSGSPVTTSGTLAVAFASGYSIPTTAKQSNWDTAYGWGNHANAGYLLASTAASTYLPLNVGAGKTITSTAFMPLVINTTATGNYLAFDVNGESKAYVGYSSNSGAFLQCGSNWVHIDNSGVFKLNNTYTFYHSGNSNLSTEGWTASTLTARNIELKNMGSSAGHGGYIDFHFNDSTADFTSRIIENASGQLAISGQLYVAGAMSCASLTATSADFRLTNFTDFHINSGGSAGITYYSAAQTSNYWNVGMNPTGATYGGRFYWYYTGSYLAYLTTTGNFVATGAITAGSASDARLKTNIRALSADAAKRIVMGLNPVTFTWNEKAGELYDQYKGDDLGMIAQEVEPYLPQAVGTIFEKYKRLDYTKFITPLISVAQDHESRIRQLERENTALRQQLRMS